MVEKLLSTIGILSMFNKHCRTLAKIKASRAIRGGILSVKRKFSKGNAGTAESLLGDSILPPDKSDREKKYKSTLAVAIAGTAIGVSHVAAVSGKYHKIVSGKSTLCIGLAVGFVTSAIWYKYIDAAYDGVTEEDISMMFEMANSTGYGNIDDDDDSAKAVDILHTLVTGKVTDRGDNNGSMFKYEEDEDDDDLDKSDNHNVFSQKVSFADTETTSTSISSTRTGFGSGGIGKSLSSSVTRKSFLPDLDRQEAEEETRKDVEAGWMDFS